MFIKRIRSLLLTLCVATLLVGCNLEYFADAKLNEFVWKPSLAIPLGELSYSVEDLFGELSSSGVNIGQNSSDIVTLTYESQLRSQPGAEFLPLANQSFGKTKAAGLSINAQGFASQFDYSEVFEFNLATTQIEAYDSIDYSKGRIDLVINSGIDAEVRYSLTLISLEENDTRLPLVVSGILSPSSPSKNVTETMNKYIGDFSKDANNNTVRNKIRARLDYQVRVSANSVIQPSDGLSFSVAMTNLEFDVAYGDFGSRKLDLNFELLNLDFFDAFRDGTISFAEPVLKFVFDNSFGFPLGMSFDQIAAVTQQGQIIPLTGSAANTTGVVIGPQIGAVGSNLTTTFALNSTNSNLPELINAMPKKVIIEVKSEANTADAPAQYNFALANSELLVGAVLDLPMIVNINGLVASQNIAFDVASDLEQAKQLTLRLIAENDLPLGGEIELVFKDEKGDIVYTVNEKALFDGAAVGSDGKTTETTTKIVDINFKDEDIRLLEKAKSIDVVTRITSTGATSNQNVKFFSDYSLKVKLAVQADVEINTKNG
ncbi:hypothetical protein ACV07N_00040 [Roseivirga echinicomitans]